MTTRNPFAYAFADFLGNKFIDKLPESLLEVEEIEKYFIMEVKELHHLEEILKSERREFGDLSWKEALTGNSPAFSTIEISRNIRESSERAQEIIENTEFLYAMQQASILQS